jgi:hypothetical protein
MMVAPPAAWTEYQVPELCVFFFYLSLRCTIFTYDTCFIPSPSAVCSCQCIVDALFAMLFVLVPS